MLRCASNVAMQKVWSRLALLVLALFVQLGVARAARGTTPAILASLAVAAAEPCVDRPSPGSNAPSGGETGVPGDDANSLEQDSPLDDSCDMECALPALLAIQQASERPQRLNAGAGVGARHAALAAPFKPPRA